MSKAIVEVAYHVKADRDKVNRLVQEHGSTLVAAVEAQEANGRPPHAVVWSDGYCLSAHSRANAVSQGFPAKPETEFLVMGMPNDCELADYIRTHIINDDQTFTFELE